MCIFCCLICSHIYWIIPTTQWENVSTECIYGSMYFLTCTVGHFIYFHMCVYITLKHLVLFMWRATNHLFYYCFILYVQQELNWYIHFFFNCKSNLLYLSWSRIVYYNTQNAMNIGLIINVCRYLKHLIKSLSTCKQDIAYDTHWTHCL